MKELVNCPDLPLQSDCRFMSAFDPTVNLKNSPWEIGLPVRRDWLIIEATCWSGLTWAQDALTLVEMGAIRVIVQTSFKPNGVHPSRQSPLKLGV